FRFAQQSKNPPAQHQQAIKQKKKIYRQGDILFKKIDTLPKSITEKLDNVVAEGEVTGHAHLLMNGALFEVINSEDLIIQAGENTKLIHNEHLPIKLEQGNYRVIRQREFLEEGIVHRVTD
ncbi:MAG: hypothetical protein ACTSPS_06180, partial [Promethearchaeota archaeon]